MDDVDPKYLMPFFDRLLCCLPEHILQKLRCNLPFRDPEVVLVVFCSFLTLKVPPIICSRRQFQILPLFQKYKIRYDIS